MVETGQRSPAARELPDVGSVDEKCGVRPAKIAVAMRNSDPFDVNFFIGHIRITHRREVEGNIRERGREGDK